MAEPGFYKCAGCNHRWSRMELKMGGNPPSVCPHCGAGRDKQGVDEARETRYVREIYGPIAAAFAGSAEKTPPKR